MVLVDVTEMPIGRPNELGRWLPSQKQRHYYSSKKKRHTLKSQVVFDLSSGTILATARGKG